MAHPALTFKAVRFVEEEELALIEETLVEEGDLIDQITGVTEKPSLSVEPVGEATPKPTPTKAKAKKPKPAKKEVKEVKDDEVDEALDNLDFDD